eukprot:767864-Hanusia_phi.AAC.2
MPLFARMQVGERLARRQCAGADRMAREWRENSATRACSKAAEAATETCTSPRRAPPPPFLTITCPSSRGSSYLPPSLPDFLPPALPPSSLASSDLLEAEVCLSFISSPIPSPASGTLAPTTSQVPP